MRSQPLDRIFVALADPGRRSMVEQISNGPATVKELAKPAKMQLPSAVKHLKVLEDGGIVISRKVGRTHTRFGLPRSV
jgi:DNA-binding transcriptional ArsR family regulator